MSKFECCLQTGSHSAPAIVITCGLDSMRFRPLTPSKEVLEQVRLKWAQGMIVDHEGFEVTPSSPVLDPGLYEYQVALPSKCCYQGILSILQATQSPRQAAQGSCAGQHSPCMLLHASPAGLHTILLYSTACTCNLITPQLQR